MKHLPILALLFLASLLISCSKSDDSNGASEFVYADTADYGANLLDTNVTKYSGSEFSFSAKIPKEGKLTIKLKKTNGGNWFIAMGTEKNWAVSKYDSNTNTQVFTSISAEKTCDLQMEILAGIYIIEYYENDASSPTRIKEIEI